MECPCPAPKAKRKLINCVPITGEKECCDENAGCPTGFKPCKMKLCPPPGCHPLDTWQATVQPCPPKNKPRPSVKYYPGECTRPCCVHWKPKDGVCKYDQPCKAHCYDHPPGIKSSGRTC
ncbi:hypothetical protein RI129_005812 [Pyrocoelia pectoralis]|uniref:Uncharacterized protein n=1 Tax=Pyrocoelia pectoralis TaxID=417401 RepID=A0AAN7ZJ91_9COLE